MEVEVNRLSTFCNCSLSVNIVPLEMDIDYQSTPFPGQFLHLSHEIPTISKQKWYLVK
jgi:hypothetical protein